MSRRATWSPTLTVSRCPRPLCPNTPGVVFNAYQENVGNAAKWCARHGLSQSCLEKAAVFRQRLAAQLHYFQIPVSASSGDATLIQRCIASAFFMNAAIGDLSRGTFRPVDYPAGRQPPEMWIHPDSALFRRVPEMVVYVEAMETSKIFLRGVTVVSKQWLKEAAPHFYHLKRPHG